MNAKAKNQVAEDQQRKMQIEQKQSDTKSHEQNKPWQKIPLSKRLNFSDPCFELGYN